MRRRAHTVSRTYRVRARYRTMYRASAAKSGNPNTARATVNTDHGSSQLVTARHKSDVYCRWLTSILIVDDDVPINARAPPPHLPTTSPDRNRQTLQSHRGPPGPATSKTRRATAYHPSAVSCLRRKPLSALVHYITLYKYYTIRVLHGSSSYARVITHHTRASCNNV